MVFTRGSLNLLNSYLSNRKQYEQFVSTKPQGSSLGPLLFKRDMNDINKASSILRLLFYIVLCFIFKSRDIKIISSLIIVELIKTYIKYW